MTGHINVMLVLQSCTDLLQVLPGSSSETFPTRSDVTCDVSNTAVQRDVVVVEEGFTAINEEVNIGMKEEEIPDNISFPDIQAELDEVSYVCVCVLLDTFHQCPEMSVVFVMPIFLVNLYRNMVGKENIFFSPCRKEIHILTMFSKDQTNLSAYAVDFLFCHPRDLRGARVLSVPLIKQHL